MEELKWSVWTLENVFNHFRYIGDQTKWFWGDFNGKPRVKHEFKSLSQCGRCNWHARRPIPDSQRFSWHFLEPSDQHITNLCCFCVLGTWGRVLCTLGHLLGDVLMIKWYVINACHGMNCFELFWDEMRFILKLENGLDIS